MEDTSWWKCPIGHSPWVVTFLSTRGYDLYYVNPQERVVRGEDVGEENKTMDGYFKY